MFMYTDYTQHLLDNVKKIHFIGCGGSGMYPLIQILSAKGYDISGSDVLDGSIIRSEREMGVKVTLGHSADNVVGADLVVYSAAIAKDNVELNAAASYGITTVERSVLLGYVSRLYKQSICVSGTHGKTTTTSMITTALELAGRDPSAVIGGKLPLIHGYGKAGKGDDIVIEACEFSETFLKLTPYLSVVLNIDNDHLDYYGSMGELKFAFKRFALMTKFMIFANADDKNTMDVMYTLDRRVRTFGIDNDGDYQAVNVQEYKPGFFEFDLKEWSKVTGHIRLAVPGRHNIYNALAMCAVCRFAGLTVEQCAAAAASFKGAGRRFEVYGECNGAVVVDQDVCTGCGTCVNSCPYEVPQIDEEAGVSSKCTMCFDRLDNDHRPWCVQACPAEARIVGDLNDPESEVSKYIVEKGAQPYMPENGTTPSVYYV